MFIFSLFYSSILLAKEKDINESKIKYYLSSLIFDKFCADEEKSDQQRDGALVASPSLSEEKYRKFSVCGENDIHERKVVYARTLKDLIRKGEEGILLISKITNMYSVKGKSELLKETQFNQKLRILLFDDDTEVDDEEYFQTLPEETLFVFRKYRKGKFRSR